METLAEDAPTSELPDFAASADTIQEFPDFDATEAEPLEEPVEESPAEDDPAVAVPVDDTINIEGVVDAPIEEFSLDIGKNVEDASEAEMAAVVEETPEAEEVPEAAPVAEAVEIDDPEEEVIIGEEDAEPEEEISIGEEDAEDEEEIIIGEEDAEVEDKPKKSVRKKAEKAKKAPASTEEDIAFDFLSDDDAGGDDSQLGDFFSQFD